MLWEEVEMSEVPISHTVSKDMKSVKRRIRIFTDWEKSHKEFHLSVTRKKLNVPTHVDRIDISYTEIYLLLVYTSQACKVKEPKMQNLLQSWNENSILSYYRNHLISDDMRWTCLTQNDLIGSQILTSNHFRFPKCHLENDHSVSSKNRRNLYIKLLSPWSLQDFS